MSPLSLLSSSFTQVAIRMLLLYSFYGCGIVLVFTYVSAEWGEAGPFYSQPIGSLAKVSLANLPSTFLVPS